MAIRLTRPSSQHAQEQWALHCSAQAQALRLDAEGASPLQTERAVIQLGAAAAMDRAATLWVTGDRELAQAWMRAAGDVLAAALIEVPWREATGRPAARPGGGTEETAWTGTTRAR